MKKMVMILSLLGGASLPCWSMQSMGDSALGNINGQDGIDISASFQSSSFSLISLETNSGLDSTTSTPSMTQWQGFGMQGAIDWNIGTGLSSTGQAALNLHMAGTVIFNPVSVYTSAWNGSTVLQTAVASGAANEFKYSLGQVTVNLTYALQQGFTDQMSGTVLSHNGLTLTNSGCPTSVCTQLLNPSWSQGSSSFAASSVVYQDFNPVSVSISAVNGTTLNAWKATDTTLSSSLSGTTASDGLLLSIGAVQGSKVVTGATGTGTTGNYTTAVSHPATNILIPSNANAQQLMQALATLSNAMNLPSLLGQGSLFR